LPPCLVFFAAIRIPRLGRERLSDRAVALIVKARAAAVALDPTLLAGHSLRSGGITEARRNGHDEQEIGKLSRHRNMDILRGYIRAADSFEGPRTGPTIALTAPPAR